MAELNEILMERIEKLEHRNDVLERQVESYKALLKSVEKNDVQREYKDRLFKFIFGNPENREWTLSLYNAVNGTDYANAADIKFNTIGDAVYMRMKNDISFIVAFEMNLWEHQSTFNPNMPMRFFIYGGRLYEKYIVTSDYYQYSSVLQAMPRPACLCFYNGRKEQDEKTILKLSDAYGGNGDIEVKVTMLNVNYGKNKEMMDACEPLREYAWLVDMVRKGQDMEMDIDTAVDRALDEMPEDFVIRDFLLENRAEVKSMFLTEYNEEKVLEQERQEGIKEGIKEGAKQKEAEVREQVAADMLKAGGMTASFIAKISRLPEEAVRNLAKALNVAVL